MTLKTSMHSDLFNPKHTDQQIKHPLVFVLCLSTAIYISLGEFQFRLKTIISSITCSLNFHDFYEYSAKSDTAVLPVT